LGENYEPKNWNTNIAIPVLSGYLILLIIARSSSLNILEPENCEFWFFGKQLRIKLRIASSCYFRNFNQQVGFRNWWL
jgi:hypothetical protein